MSLTEAQQAACQARGNVLVVAGAGTGKTRALVERCLHCLLHEHPRLSLDELLVVTFTEAAAAEMRQRIRTRLEDEAAAQPNERHWNEQLALFETANIGTLHAFCLQLVRRHFFQLGLDPQLAVLPEEEARLLAEDTLAGLLEKYYGGRGSKAEAVQELIEVHGRGRDQPLRALILRLHHYSQTLPNPAGWLAEQRACFDSPEPVLWRNWLLDALAGWRSQWLPNLESISGTAARDCADALRGLPVRPAPGEAAQALAAILALRDDARSSRNGSLKALEKFLAEAEFLSCLCPQANGVAKGAKTGKANADPLAEDWNWVRGQMSTLLELTAEFTAAFAEAKRESGMVDFHDLEQHALALLWDFKADQATPLAAQWRRKLRFIFVDEYQDINAAQDKIIAALSRQGAEANRFLVGDVKQSIYRFRLANPYIFQGYLREWSAGTGKVIALRENFRSRERLIDYINSLFSLVMKPDLGGIAYDEQAQLRFGAPADRAPLSAAADPAHRVELHVRLKSKDAAPETEDEANEALDEFRDLEEAAKEARLVAQRLLQLRRDGYQVWDETARQFRPMAWSDVVILLRAPARKAESYAKEFARLNLPLQVARGGFYQSLEICDLLNLLRLLDNPLQDLPVLAVLRSPLVGLTVNDLARIRLALPRGHFWSALLKWAETQGTKGAGPETEATARKVSVFLDRFAHWRRSARQISLSACLEMLLAETHYADWLLTQDRGEQRRANVQRLLAMAGQFDQFQRQGLFRFLRFIDAQQTADSEPEVPAATEADAVRLMSIHQSKGLEFPVVVLADLGKPFNLSELRAEIILDEQYGLCPRIKPPHSGRRYPSLAYWLARRRQARESLAEELRLLYVAMTRARDTLILSGSISATRYRKVWLQQTTEEVNGLLTANSCADWLGVWFAHNAGPAARGCMEGETGGLRWKIHDDTTLGSSERQAEALEPVVPPTPSPEVWQLVQQRLSWKYPWVAATKQPAKTSVSALRRLAAEAEQESSLLFDARVSTPRPGFKKVIQSAETAADAGTAHHTFLQHVSLEHNGSLAEMQAEAKRLQTQGALTPEQVALLDFPGLFAFWDSELGRKFRAQAAFVQRELAFTARFSPAELAQLTNQPRPEGLDQEFVVVQGVADLVALLPREVWLLDFKTDDARPNELKQRVEHYRPQLKIYSEALSRIYARPVSQCWLYFISVRQAIPILNGKTP
jgi:ATP-dependent helicase/nuclease subunit A